MHTLAQRLIAEERRVADDIDIDRGSRAGFRVCEKLRRPLCTFAGVAGFRSLLSRALVLAQLDAPMLAGVKIKADGTFEYSPEIAAQLATDEAAHAAAALAGNLIGLLITFIGEASTLRLVHDVWPMAADPKSGGK